VRDVSLLVTRPSSLCRNHPIIKEDGLLAVFLTEPSFEAWRKHSSVSLEEESYNKKVDRVEEMSIPSDLEEKLM
jgi:sorting nexin-8